MTPQIAYDYIRARMEELGHKGNYHIRFRHFVLAPMETRVIAQGLQLFVLADTVENLRIESMMGVYDLLETASNELQYEHQGDITMASYSPIHLHVKMIQVIFKHN
jgi:hypothetical protein